MPLAYLDRVDRVNLAPAVLRVEHPRSPELDVVFHTRNGKLRLRTMGRRLRIGWMCREWTVGRYLGQHRGSRLEMVFRIEQVFIAGVDSEPDVVVTVLLVGDVDHDAGGRLARIEHLQTVRAVHACLWRTRPASRRQGRLVTRRGPPPPRPNQTRPPARPPPTQ